MVRVVASLVLASAVACASRPPAGPGPAPAPLLAEEAARLAIPPGPDAPAALARLDARARASDTEAAWTRAHYLLDLFDDARFRGAEDSRALLGQALELSDLGRGAQATDRALAALLVEIDRLMALDRLHPGAAAARALLDFDHRPPAGRREVFQRMVELKAVARAATPLAANARLRLFGYCRRAFEDAPGSWARLRPRVLAHCLYPIYDSDPEPYFADDPQRRPPPPRWEDLRDGAARLLDPIGEESRLRAAARAQAAALGALLAEQAALMPAALDPVALDLPALARAGGYDHAPLLELGDGGAAASEAAEIAARIRPALQADGRGALAVALAAGAPGQPIVRAAEAAVLAGAARLELLVATEQELVVPPGDYWSGRAGGGRIARVGAVILSLAPMGAAAGPDPGESRARALAWDPERAALGLHLAVERDAWRLVAATGELGRFSAGEGEDPVGPLREALRRARAAFPDEDGLVLVPGDGASYAGLLAAAAAAARDANGAPLFARLGLAAAAPDPRESALARRIERRFAAAVRIGPEGALAGRREHIRACYQALLEARPRLGGSFRLELRDGRAALVSGPADRALRACVQDNLAAAMVEQGIAAVVVELSPGG